MKLKLITLLFLVKIVPAMAQEEINTTTKPIDTIALKQVAVDAAVVTEKTAPVLTEQQIAEIQKTTLENQKLAEEAIAATVSAAKEVEKEQRKLEKEQRKFEREQERISDAEKDVIKTKEKIIREKRQLEKMNSRLAKDTQKGKLTDIEIEKEYIKISKQQIEIKELQQDLDNAEKKLNKLRN